MTNTVETLKVSYAETEAQAWMDAYSFFGYGVKVTLVEYADGEWTFSG